MIGRRKIEVGQRFERLGRWSRIWQVEAVIDGPGRVPNAVLHDISEPANKCTLSPRALLDRKRFRALDSASEADAAETGADKGAETGDTKADADKGAPAGEDGALEKQKGPHGTGTVVPLRSRRQERHMAVESRTPDAFRIVCTRQSQPHRFEASYPDGRVTCPTCGYAASAVALLMDFTSEARPPAGHRSSVRDQRPASPVVATPELAQAPTQSRPETRQSPMARILALPRKRLTA